MPALAQDIFYIINDIYIFQDYSVLYMAKCTGYTKYSGQLPGLCRPICI